MLLRKIFISLLASALFILPCLSVVNAEGNGSAITFEGILNLEEKKTFQGDIVISLQSSDDEYEIELLSTKDWTEKINIKAGTYEVSAELDEFSSQSYILDYEKTLTIDESNSESLFRVFVYENSDENLLVNKDDETENTDSQEEVQNAEEEFSPVQQNEQRKSSLIRSTLFSLGMLFVLSVCYIFAKNRRY